ncbi:MAG: hypothetical protein C4522_03200 [Desulfobacteraceae bacterium]|nr:MAG: hypothetical protein C4522_03200 [Desulfobacteraceae bacterium]
MSFRNKNNWSPPPGPFHISASGLDQYLPVQTENKPIFFCSINKRIERVTLFPFFWPPLFFKKKWNKKPDSMI